MKKTKYNILIVHNKYRFTGGEDSVVVNESELLKSYGHHVYLYERKNSEIDEYSFFKKAALLFRTIFSFSSAHEVSEMIRQHHIDIVHVHNTLPLISFSVYYAAKKQRCALVQTIHNFRLLCPNGIFFRDNQICQDCLKSLTNSIRHACYRNSRLQTVLVAFALWIHRRLGTFRLPDAYICLTEFNKNSLLSLIPEDKLYVKPNFTMRPSFDTPVEKSRNYFLYASRLDKSKGIFILLEAFLQLSDTKLIIVGTGPDEQDVRQFITDHHMNHVHVLGFTNHKETLSYLYHAKALLFPSQWFEGFPVILAESLSVGTPVIGSNLGNTASIVTHQKTGLLFQYNVVSDLVAKIREFNSPSFDYTTLEQNCLTVFNEHYSPECNYNALFSIYHHIIAR